MLQLCVNNYEYMYLKKQYYIYMTDTHLNFIYMFGWIQEMHRK